MGEKVRVRVGSSWYEVEVGDLDSDPVRTVVDGVAVDVSLGDVLGAVKEPQSAPSSSDAAVRPPQARKEFFAPAAGVIVSLSVAVGDQVVTGDEVCEIELMDGVETLRADWSGVIKGVNVEVGQEISAGQLIAELE